MSTELAAVFGNTRMANGQEAQNGPSPDVWRINVLVVDDENGPRQALRILLKEDYHVLLANDAASARCVLQSESIDVVITDLRMPKESGVSLLEFTKKNHADVEVIVLTGYGELQTAVKAVECGAFAYIEKPFDNRAMFDCVRRAVEKRRQELERRRLEELALEANRFETLGRFVSGMLHDLSTPLSVIGSYIELLQTDSERKDIDKKLDVMFTQARHCSDLVRSAMTFLRHDSGPITALCLNSVVESCMQVSAPVLMRQQVEAKHALASSLPLFRGDFVLVRQAILNLITNAAQAMEGQEPPREVMMRTWAEEEHVCVSVRDTGPGVSPAIRMKVFNTFFTTKGVKGTGLGLAVVRHIMKRHGGEVILRDSCGRGAEFVLRFPIGPLTT